MLFSMKEIPKILLLVPELSLPGGVSGYYNTLKLETNDNINYFIINKGRPQTAFGTFLRLITNYCLFFCKVIKGRYELIHINPSLDRRSFYRDSVFIIISRMLNRKTLIFFHGWLDTFEKKIKNSKLKSFLFKISYAKANKYIVLSNLFKNKLIELGVSSETEFFIETTVADSTYINELDLKKKYFSFNEKIKFLFLSRIEKAKGIYIAIDAYRKFLTKRPERKSCMIIAGDGPELPAVKRYVEQLNIPHINFLGYISDENKKKVLLESHILIFPSYTEGLPLSILEGMLYGMPIISRVTGGITDIILPNVNGYLSESFEPSIFAEFLSILAFDKELYRKIAEQNHRIALEKYTSEKVRERLLNIYGEC
jgi:glycosyltransferase involved in cell wall biosynthesis